ncbi:MAG: o-succinylbenzoate--CoA ligase [Ktedonobacterales bacterium]
MTANHPLNSPTGRNVLPDWLMRAASRYPRRIAIEDGHRSWTFAELDNRATHLAVQLRARGVAAGDRVALLASNGLVYGVVVHALTRAGAVLVPLNTRLSESELCWQISDVQASLLIYDDRNAAQAIGIEARLPGLPRFPLPEDVGDIDDDMAQIGEAAKSLVSEIDLEATQAIIYTSGTTGRPKGVLITYGMHWWSAIGSLLNMGSKPDDCWLACLPFFHIGGLSILMRGVIYGMRVLVYERFDARSINEALRQKQVSIISVVAVMLQRLLSALDSESGTGRYPPSLRCVLLGGGPAPQHLLEECARREIPVVQTYGMTESCSQAVTLAPEEALRRLGSAGRPLPSVQLRILVDEREARAGESGEIMLRGPIITPGYTGESEAAASAFRDGWFATGDYGYLDDEGYLYVLDRRSDLIISGGENVYPAQIEAALQEHPAVAEAGVCGVSHERWGQVPVAFVVLADGSSASQEDLLAYLATRLAHYKIPQEIHFASQLPRTSSGKLIRRKLPYLLP